MADSSWMLVGDGCEEVDSASSSPSSFSFSSPSVKSGKGMEDGVASSSTGDALGVKNDLTVIVGWAVALAIEDNTASVD